ncbi:MAG: hypothetical protein DRJ38_08855 [Thermoprotei archaeon]|nr:MAG: hypothetical protein DRJ38_08855 [Thermoprotei archaeon]
MSRSILKIVFTAIFIFLFLAYSVEAQTEYTIEKCNLIVYPEGYVLVSMYITLPEETYAVNISLIGEPSSDYIILVLNEQGEFLAYEIKDNVIEVITVDSRAVNITYVTASLAYKEKDRWLLEADLPVDSEIVLPEKSLIVELNEIPLLIDMRGESPVLLMPKGFVKIGYIIPPPITPPSINQTQGEQPQMNQTQQTQTNQTETTHEEEGSAEQPSQGTTTKPESGAEIGETPGQGKEFELPILYIAITAAVLIPIVSILLLRKRKKKLDEELRYEEVEVLNALKMLGGQAFQSEVAKIVDQPTTTLWRNIKRLEEKGYIKVEKKFGRNFLTLLKF